MTDDKFMGLLVIVCVVVFVAMYAVNAYEKAECAKLVCPEGMALRLLGHECLCVVLAQQGVGE